MNNFEEQSYSDLIYRFMDGETGGVEQNLLFEALAKDSELQMEFQQAVSITKGFGFDKSTLAPPAKLTNQLFTQAGFQAPMQAVQTVGTSIYQKILVPVSSAFVGAIISTLLFFNFFQNPSNLTASSSEYSALIPTYTISSPDKEVIVKQDNNQFISSEYEEDEQIIEQKKDIFQNIAQAEISYNEELITFESSSDFKGPITDEQQIEEISYEFAPSKYSIELRGITGLAFLPTREIMPEKFNPLNNLAIGFTHNFSSNHSGGIYLGKESLQLYTFTQNQNEFDFDLEPNLFWAGLSYKYSGDELIASITPFSELILAGSKYGPVGKANVGISYNPQDFISISIGVEGTGLMYKYLGKYKFTEKLSLFYNLGFHF